MRFKRFWLFLLAFGTVASMGGLLRYFKQDPLSLMAQNHHCRLIVQNVNDYQGPSKKVPGNPELIRVQVIVNDAVSPDGVQIESVEFNHKKISLKPRDVYGFRGQSSFQLPPGKYKLKWTVQRDALIWPRTIPHEEEVTLDPRDLWIQITITGEEANIS